jgi:hypothetical protein
LLYCCLNSIFNLIKLQYYKLAMSYAKQTNNNGYNYELFEDPGLNLTKHHHHHHYHICYSFFYSCLSETVSLCSTYMRIENRSCKPPRCNLFPSFLTKHHYRHHYHQGGAAAWFSSVYYYFLGCFVIPVSTYHCNVYFHHSCAFLAGPHFCVENSLCNPYV